MTSSSWQPPGKNAPKNAPPANTSKSDAGQTRVAPGFNLAGVVGLEPTTNGFGD